MLARFYRPGGRGFELSFCPGVENPRIKKNCPGGWSGLELTDTLTIFRLGAQCAPLQVCPCCAEMVCSRLMKLSDF